MLHQIQMLISQETPMTLWTAELIVHSTGTIVRNILRNYHSITAISFIYPIRLK